MSQMYPHDKQEVYDKFPEYFEKRDETYIFNCSGINHGKFTCYSCPWAEEQDKTLDPPCYQVAYKDFERHTKLKEILK